MSTDQPPPGPDEPRDGDSRDPFAKYPRANGSPYEDHTAGAEPYRGMPPLAHLGRRLIARIIDALLIGIPVGLVVTAIAGGYDPIDGSARSTTVTLVYVLVYFLYEGLMLTRDGQTVGKKAMKIRVAMLENGQPPVGQAGWVRAAVYALPEIVPCCGFFFWLVNVLWCTWDRPYRQCLHDKAAKTLVVSAVP
ncbi:RDD family protein [Streptomyces malaysiensis subsp. malaysiensis]|uniref:RDD family protein n=1 Tax=Streptomyces malaysiensis TaxID=92644 RepID=A0ABX6W6R5_STRMQ|nr:MULTISPECIES: RDD family protein [Streptomyces]AUA13472.1 RDD family protein [Streptomyces sp. M56]MYX56713.1 RDD family protein [Streptomyces sp. SID8382]QDL72609.1 RDD family protein [Streptomyces malaysiensis]QPI56708.1 RDD family protein [Streptomyces solisilvae]UHH18218.1 RDD family protein [Streptomyces sp. HNM0561]